MAITVSIYDSYHENLLKGNINWLSGIIKASLHIGETFVATESNYTQVVADITDPDYVDGGIALTNVSVAVASNVAKVDSPDDINYGSAVTIAAANIILRKDTGTPATDILMLHINLGATKSSTNGVFKYTLHANGLVRQGANGFV